MKQQENQNLLLKDLSNCIRILTADAVEAAKSGHPGMPLGMAHVITILAFEFLKFNPQEPKWFNRDRLVLSAGHGSMLLYAFYYLTGYQDFSLNDIKNFRQLHSKAAGHPESHMYEAIETTTGPLGQGFANAVGMAIGQKKHQAQLGKEACDYKIYTIVGDGCLMEGISYEAASLAGHLKLDNLIVIFDDNNISIDGNTNLAVSENQLAKFQALGFEVEAIDGHDFDQIRSALSRANSATKPYFIACKTVIGSGTNTKAGSEKAHGSPLGNSEIEFLKRNAKFAMEPFAIDEKLLEIWRRAGERGRERSKSSLRGTKTHNVIASVATQSHEARVMHVVSPQEATALAEPRNDVVWLSNPRNDDALTRNDDAPSEPTRVSSGKILQELAKTSDQIIFGSADLALSNNLYGDNNKPITAEDFSGNFIHYGVREHAMGGVMNGLALSGFLPIGGTFFVFSDYMRPAIRLAAIMRLKVIYVMTHDSIGVGEDGPTHQPIEHLATFRAMPNIKVFRPADYLETLECYQDALQYDGPSIMALSRQNVRPIPRNDTPPVTLGAYIVSEAKTSTPDIVIFATGSELSLGYDVQKILEESHKLSVRLISVPCFENLESQGKNYLKTLTAGSKLKVAIEAGTSFGWHKIIGEEGMFFGLDQFGLSAPADVLYDYFGLTADKIVAHLTKTK